MEHDAIAAQHTVERYVLGELTSEQRDSFEEHYFQCAECGDEVRSTSVFLANLRAAMAEGEAKEPAAVPVETRRPSYWLRPAWGLALAGVLLIFSGYQTVVIRNLAAVRQVNPFVLLPETRGEPRVVEFTPGEPQMFSFPIPTGTASSFHADIVNAATNAVVHQAPVAEPPRDNPAFMLLPKELRPGQYVLVLRAVDGEHAGQQIDRYPFEVKSR